jgi:hypothetical protein
MKPDRVYAEVIERYIGFAGLRISAKRILREENMIRLNRRNSLRAGMRRHTREILRHVWFRGFLASEKLGVHILPNNFYSPVQDFRWLSENKDVWMGRSRLTGIKWDLNEQLEWLKETCAPYYHEVAGLAFYHENVEREWGPGYGEIESQVLHCFLRSKAPRQIIEIGSGESTVCMLHASKCNAQAGRTESKITCVDPYPTKVLQGIPGVAVVKQQCQAVPAAVFEQLESGDLLFVDSSHAVKTGSDVIRIYLDIIPNLAAGVFIHIHDINLPYLYNRGALSYYFDQNSQETALLVALLTRNKHLSALASLSALHYDRSQEMMGFLSDYRPEANNEGLSPCYPRQGHFPNSIWLRTG